ncbi:hypothetical protein MRB53_039610 [Persea americana]|nr:hypothetical protein MRB53_039610 [Persea americana]
MTLPTRKLGKNGPQVTALGFGLMGLSSFYGPPKPDSERFAILDQAYAAGELFWDSAALYGDNEDLIGRWLKRNPEKRKDIFLATKFAFRAGWTLDSSPEHARESCENSLKVLGVETIDLFYCHRLNAETPVEKTVTGLKALQDEGKIKYIGLSECSSEALRRACKVVHIDAVQIEYSPFSLDIESDAIGLLQTCRELGVAVVAYSPLGRGMMSGTLRSPEDFSEDDFRRHAPRFSKENFPKNLVLVDQIVELAKKKGVTPSQLTLAWLMAQGDDIFPIPGTTNPKRLQENIDSLSIKLTKEEEAEFRKAVQAADVAGDRYASSMADTLFVTTKPL